VTVDGAEELAQPERRTTARRLRLELVVGAAVLLGILLVTRHHHGSTVDAGPTSGPTATSSRVPASVGTAALAIYPVPDRHAGDVAHCPLHLECQRVSAPTLGIREALQDAFPGARVEHAQTTRIDVKGYGTALWTSNLQARVGDELVRLRVQPRSPDDKQVHGSSLFGGHAITHWESVQNQVRVVIDVVSPADSATPLTAIEQLARDARLTSPW
jgi:hypothetical protein